MDTSAKTKKKYRGAGSAEEAAGRLLILGFEGTRYTSALGSWFKGLKPGGLVLFKRNIESAEQTAALIGDMKKLAEDVTGEAPFVAADQEGGRVSRLPRDTMAFIYGESERDDASSIDVFNAPTARAFGRDGSADQVELTYRAMGRALARLGFNLDFAPVLDLDTNEDSPVIGDRSFGADPETVGVLGRAAIKGLQDAGVLACGKHFPGHGGTALDSHLDLPEDDRPKARFDENELEPFRAAIDGGVDAVMTAHVLYPAFDETYPATLSERIVTGILREEMGFAGLIISDDLDMNAIASRWGDAEAARLALRAGCDQLLICRDGPRQRAVYETAVRMIGDGVLDNANVAARLQRAYEAKRKTERV